MPKRQGTQLGDGRGREVTPPKTHPVLVGDAEDPGFPEASVLCSAHE